MGKRVKLDGSIVVAYIRQSSSKQEMSADTQRLVIETWARAKGVRVVAWCEDMVKGAAPIERCPALLEAIHALRTHRAGRLVAVRQDRLGRATEKGVMLRAMVAATGAALETVEDGVIDCSTFGGEVMAVLRDLNAKEERRKIAVRTVEGMARLKASGRSTGKAPYGWRVGEDGTTLIEAPSEQAVIARVRELHGAGAPVLAIARTLASEGATSRAGTPLSRQTIYAILAA